MKKLFTLMMLVSVSLLSAANNKPAGCPSCSRSGYAVNNKSQQRNIAQLETNLQSYPMDNQDNQNYLEDGNDQDLILIKAIDDALEPVLEFQNISFDVNNGAVELTGTVVKQADKIRAETTVKNINGVRSVDNQITVQKY